MRQGAVHRATRACFEHVTAVLLAAVALLLGLGPAAAMGSGSPEELSAVEAQTPAEWRVSTALLPAGQDPREAVMVAAGAWVLDRVPGGGGHLDPHRSGAGKDGSRLERVAGALGLGMATLDDVRDCVDVMDPTSCTLTVDRLLAVSAPRIDGDAARVKVYAWYRADAGAQPVMQRSWELRLARSEGIWRVVSGG